MTASFLTVIYLTIPHLSFQVSSIRNLELRTFHYIQINEKN